jgi:hypothetical protein
VLKNTDKPLNPDEPGKTLKSPKNPEEHGKTLENPEEPEKTLMNPGEYWKTT